MEKIGCVIVTRLLWPGFDIYRQTTFTDLSTKLSSDAEETGQASTKQPYGCRYWHCITIKTNIRNIYSLQRSYIYSSCRRQTNIQSEGILSCLEYYVFNLYGTR